MKQLVFMVAVTAFGMIGSFTHGPFVGLAVYVFYDILRPQYIWRYSGLPDGLSWSLYVALAALVATPLVGPATNRELNRGGRMTIVALLVRHRPYYLFMLWVILTYFTAIRPSAGDFVMEGYVKTLLMYTVGIAAISTVRQVWALMMVYVIALTYISWEINLLYFTQGYLGIARDGHGGLDNNGAGMLLAMGLPICVFAWEAYTSRWRWFFVAVIPLFLHAVLLTYSRGAMLSLIVTAPFWVFRGTERRLKIGIGLAVLAMVPVLAGAQIRERFASTAKFDEDGSAQSRFTSWHIGWKMALERPIFGFGVRNSSLFTRLYGADMEGRVIHSQYLQVGADNGLIGLGLYLWLVGAGMWGYQRVIRAARQRPDPESKRVLLAAMAAQASLVTFLTGAVFLSCEMFEPQYWLLMLGLHLPLVYRPATDPVPPRGLRVRPWVAVPPVRATAGAGR